MKVKNILIYYSKTDMRSLSESMRFEKIIEDILVGDGKKVKRKTRNMMRSEIVFDDGSTILTVPISYAIRGYRFSHIFVHDNVYELIKPNKGFIQSHIKIDEEFNLSIDDRFLTFNFSNEKLEIKAKNNDIKEKR